MSDAEFRARITANDEASDVLDDVAAKGDKLENQPVELTVDAKVNQAIGQLQDLVDEAKRAQTAADALGDALGPQLASRMDLNQLVVGFEKAGLSLDEITAKADELGASLRDVAGPAGENLDALGKRAKATSDSTEELSHSAQGANSALANMVGNSVQDLGALGGLAGSAGVAIGQMAEYASDAVLETESLGAALSSMAAIAGPVAAMALAVQLVTSNLQQMSKGKEAMKALDEDQVKAFTEALRGSGSAIDSYADHLRQLGKVEGELGPAHGGSWWQNALPGIGDLTGALSALGLYGNAVTDLTKVLDQAGISVDQWSRIVQSSNPTQALNDLRAALAQTSLSDDDRAHVLESAKNAQDNYTEAQKNASVMNRVFGQSSQDAAKSAEQLAQEQEQAVQAAKDHAIALSQANDKLVDMSSSFSEMSRRGDALSALFDLSSSAVESASKVRDITSAIGDLKDSAKGIKLSDAIDTSNVKADKFLDAMDQLRPQIQAKITEAFETGGSDAAQSTADGYVQQIVDALGGRLSPDKVKELLGISDLSTTLKVAVDQSTLAKVKSELDVLTGIGGETPFTASVKLALDAGTISPQAAQALVQSALGTAGVSVPLDPVTDPTALAEAGKFMQDYVAGHPATLPVQGDTTGVQDAAKGAAADVAKTPATQPIGGDTSQAQKDAQGFRSDTDKSSATVGVDADTAVAAAVLLAFLARSRVADIYANVPNLAVANAALNGLTGARTAPVYAEAVGVDAANRAINSIANQQRTARIDVSVVPTSVLVRVNGGG